MPSAWTFTIKPIKELIVEEMTGDLWVDPYAGMNSPAKYKNDINPEAKADFHMDALEFLKGRPNNSADGVFFDPPYSLNQLRQCYEAATKQKAPGHIFNARYNAQQKDEIARIVKPGGKAICFGWNSVGVGKTRGFQHERVLMVCHGRMHNDTIVTVERKMNNTLDG